MFPRISEGAMRFMFAMMWVGIITAATIALGLAGGIGYILYLGVKSLLS